MEAIGAALRRHPAPGSDLLDEMEEALLSADVGVATTRRLLEGLGSDAARAGASGEGMVLLLKARVLRLWEGLPGGGLDLGAEVPGVIMVVGVNGVGKTTTAAKLAHLLRREGRRVILAAADTFRAAGIDQLLEWGRRAGVEVVRHREGSDPGAVVFDAIAAARARKAEAVVVDTAGRLHTRKNLMEELKKIRRVVARECPGQPAEVLLVVDATTGQNAIAQARTFHEALGVTGIVLTKLDGTARGGVVLAIAGELRIPVKLVGVGEGLDDLEPFEPSAFADALLR